MRPATKAGKREVFAKDLMVKLKHAWVQCQEHVIRMIHYAPRAIPGDDTINSFDLVLFFCISSEGNECKSNDRGWHCRSTVHQRRNKEERLSTYPEQPRINFYVSVGLEDSRWRRKIRSRGSCFKVGFEDSQWRKKIESGAIRFNVEEEDSKWGKVIQTGGSGFQLVLEDSKWRKKIQSG